MIERAERYAAAEDVRPGDRAVVDGHHLDVEATTLRLADVVLVGVPTQRTSASKRRSHVTVPRHTTVTVLADAATLDVVEMEVMDALRDGHMEPGVEIDNGYLLVTVNDETWTVPLRNMGSLPSVDRGPADEQALSEP